MKTNKNRDFSPKNFSLSMVLLGEVGLILSLHAVYHFLNLGFGNSNTAISFLSTIIVGVAIFAAWWMLLSTIIYLIISLVSPATIQTMQGKSALKSLSFPKARKIIDAALVATIIGSGTVAGPMFAQAATQQNVYVTAENENVDPFAPVEDVSPEDSTTTTTTPEESKTDDAKTDENKSDETTTTTIPVEESAPEESPNNGSLTDIINSSIDKEKENSSTTTTTEEGKSDSGSDNSSTTTNPLIPIEGNESGSSSSEPTTTTTTIDTEVGGKQEEVPVGSDTNSSPTTSEQAQGNSYTVASGDNFWNIASNHLNSTLGRQPTNQEVTNYWIQLVEANKGTIKSGNPNLIYAGEVVTLP